MYTIDATMFEDERKNSLIREEENNLPQMKPLFFLYVLLNLVKYKEKKVVLHL